MLSVPLFTVQRSTRILLVDSRKLGTLVHVRNLSLGVYFFNFPQYAPAHRAPYNMSGWIQICDILASMSSLRYLCVNISQEQFFRYTDPHSQMKSMKLARELLKPLESIKMAEGGRFDVITQGWKVPYEIHDDLPFRLIQERPPSLTDLATRTLELGDFSQSSYIKMTSMPWPISCRPYTPPWTGRPTPLPTEKQDESSTNYEDPGTGIAM